MFLSRRDVMFVEIVEKEIIQAPEERHKIRKKKINKFISKLFFGFQKNLLQ